MKYHITNDGTVGPCLAFFGPCPYASENHFETKAEAKEFEKEWEENRIKFESLALDKLTDPRQKGKIRPSKFTDREAEFIRKDDGTSISINEISDESMIFLDDDKYLQPELKIMQNEIERRKMIGTVSDIYKKYDFLDFKEFENAYAFGNSLSRLEGGLGQTGKDYDNMKYNLIPTLIAKNGVKQTLRDFGFGVIEVKYKNSSLIIFKDPENIFEEF